MVEDERRGGLANAAGPVVAGQHLFPAPGETRAAAASAVVARLAKTVAEGTPAGLGSEFCLVVPRAVGARPPRNFASVNRIVAMYNGVD